MLESAVVRSERGPTCLRYLRTFHGVIHELLTEMEAVLRCGDIINKLITNDETRDDNNTRRVTPTVKCEPNHIKHCEINNAQSVESNIVFASFFLKLCNPLFL